MKNYIVKFKSWYKIREKGNIHIPLLSFSFNKESFMLALLGFSISIWKEEKP